MARAEMTLPLTSMTTSTMTTPAMRALLAAGGYVGFGRLMALPFKTPPETGFSSGLMTGLAPGSSVDFDSTGLSLALRLLACSPDAPAGLSLTGALVFTTAEDELEAGDVVDGIADCFEASGVAAGLLLAAIICEGCFEVDEEPFAGAPVCETGFEGAEDAGCTLAAPLLFEAPLFAATLLAAPVLAGAVAAG